MRPVLLDEELFTELAEARGDGLISVLMATHVKGPEIAQDRIRLKNALTEVDGMLTAADWRRTDRDARIEKARGLLDDEDFWAHQARGLALYIDAEGDITPVALGEEPPALSTIADCFHVRHLLAPLLRTPLPALVLTKGSVALFAVDSGNADVVDADLPASLDDANWFVDRERQEQRHADSAGSAGVRHGHHPSDRVTEDFNRFLRAVAHALPDSVGKGPLVVFGDDPVVDSFRRVFDGEVIGLGLDGTGRADSPVEIGRRVGAVIDERASARLVANREAAQNALGTADTVTLFPDVLYAAVSGRLSHVYVRNDADPIWGRFDAPTLDAAAVDARAVGTVDLLDRLVVTALGTGAAVLPMTGDADGCDFAGVRRF